MKKENTPQEPDPVNGPFCPELPAIMGAKDALGRSGFILAPCIGEKCAKYLGCQVVPKLAEKFYRQTIINPGPVS